MMPRTGRGQISLFSACLPGWEASTVVHTAAALGLRTVEWASGPGHAIEQVDQGRRVKDLCGRAGIRVAGISVQDPEVTLATPALAKPHLELAVALEAPHMRLFAPVYRGGSLSAEQQQARRGLDQLVDVATAAGVAILVETSPETLAPTPELAVSLVEHLSPELAGVLYDPGNMVIEGHVAPALAIARLGRHLRHVHVKNVAWSRRGGTWRWQYASLAAGMLDWRSIITALASAEYGGSFSIDHLAGEVTAAKLESETGLLRSLLADGFGSDAGRSSTPRTEGARDDE
jgi:sugar phosphate isomerase/epimerase